MKNYKNILQNCILFNGLSEDETQAVLVCLKAVAKSYSKGQFIFKEGDIADKLGIVLKGKVQVVRTDYIYGTQSIVADIGESSIFAESFACADIQSMPVDVVCTESCEILLIDCKRLTTTCNNACGFHNKLIFNLLKVIAKNNLNLHSKIEVTSKKTTSEKLMAYLTLEAKRQKSARINIPYNRQQLADYLGVERSGLSVEIGKLCKRGIISACKKQFILHGKSEQN